MSNAPERIWASAGETWDGEVEGTSWDDGLYTRMQENSYDLEYIRADLVPQWQPIETALVGGQYITFNGYNEYYSHLFNDVWHLVDHYGYFQVMEPQPTHWMPIPTPPTVPKQEP